MQGQKESTYLPAAKVCLHQPAGYFSKESRKIVIRTVPLINDTLSPCLGARQRWKEEGMERISEKGGRGENEERWRRYLGERETE